MKEHVLNQKKAVVDEIKGHINDAKSMVIVEYTKTQWWILLLKNWDLMDS